MNNIKLAGLVLSGFLLFSAGVAASERPPWATDAWEPITDEERKPPTVTEIDRAAVPVQASQGISYITGGLGSAERAWMDKHGAAYGWKMVFSQGERGGFVAGVAVRIFDEQGQAVFAATTDGPWLLVDLPAGEYQAKATFREQTRQFSVRLNQTQQVSQVNFSEQ